MLQIFKLHLPFKNELLRMYLLRDSPAFYEHTAYETTLRFNSDTLIDVFDMLK